MFWLKFVVVGFTMVVVVMEEIGVGGGGREKEEEGRGIIVFHLCLLSLRAKSHFRYNLPSHPSPFSVRV